MKILDYELVSNYEKIHVAIKAITEILESEHHTGIETGELADILDKLCGMSSIVDNYIKIDP